MVSELDIQAYIHKTRSSGSKSTSVNSSWKVVAAAFCISTLSESSNISMSKPGNSTKSSLKLIKLGTAKNLAC